MNAGTDANVFKASLTLNWTGPYKSPASILTEGAYAGPRSPAYTRDGRSFPFGAVLLYFELSSDMVGADARRRVFVVRCKFSAKPPRQQ